MVLIYLDNCALQRPLDDRTQFRVRIEADAMTEVLSEVEDARLALATSPALRSEASRRANRSRREFALRALAFASHDVSTSEETDRLAETFVAGGIRPFDAFHLAYAVALN